MNASTSVLKRYSVTDIHALHANGDHLSFYAFDGVDALVQRHATELDAMEGALEREQYTTARQQETIEERNHQIAELVAALEASNVVLAGDLSKTSAAGVQIHHNQTIMRSLAAFVVSNSQALDKSATRAGLDSVRADADRWAIVCNMLPPGTFGEHEVFDRASWEVAIDAERATREAGRATRTGAVA